MKKRITSIILVFVMLALSLTGCGKLKIQDGKVVVLPPVRVGKKNHLRDYSLDTNYDFKSTFAEADFVAHVRIGNWLSEKKEGMSTRYKAEIIKCYKGDMAGKFTLVQSGSSWYTLPDYPLFTYGNEFLVICKQYENKKNTYYIIGSFVTTLDTAITESGEVYFMDRTGLLSEQSEVVKYIKTDAGEEYYLDLSGVSSDREGKLVSYEALTDLKAELKKYVVERDSILSEYSYPYIFSEADIEALATDAD